MKFRKQKNLLKAQNVLNELNLLQFFEKKLLEQSQEASIPIFIIGLPRSGTTLLYQLLIDAYDFSYFNNVSNFFYNTPVLFSYLSKKLLPKYNPKSYESRYGFAKGLNSPSESGFIFRNWFDSYEMSKRQIHKSIMTVAKINDAPFLSKNLYNNFRLKKLNQIFPNMLVIEVKRNDLFVAQSLLFGRRTNSDNHTYNNWFGLKPSNYEELLKISDPFSQVHEQIVSIKSETNLGIEYIDDSRHYILSYEELCKNPTIVLNNLIDFFNSHNLDFTKNSNDNLALQNSNKILLEKDQWNRLINHFEV